MIKLPKISIIAAIVTIILFSSFQNARAQIITQEFDPILNQETGISKPITKIVFSKVKRQQIFKTTEQKYAQEFAYFFHKVGFKRSPVSHLLFENGEVASLNPDWQIHQSNNNLNTGVLFVLLVYDNEFQLNKFDQSIRTLTEEVKQAVPIMNISSIEGVELRDFVIERDEKGIGEVSFKDPQSTNDIRSYFANINFKERPTLQVALESINVTELVEFNTTIKAKVKIKNSSKFDLIFSESNQMQLSFEKDSPLYVNTSWVSPQIPLLLKEGFIKADSSNEFEIDLQTPILPGKLNENLSLKSKDKTIDTKPISLVVKDSGQKVLKIKSTELGYLTIRKDARIDSAEVGRAPVGNTYLYSSLENGFYKIQFNGKEGWVFAKYIEVLK
jgi:hypothetical protein